MLRFKSQGTSYKLQVASGKSQVKSQFWLFGIGICILFIIFYLCIGIFTPLYAFNLDTLKASFLTGDYKGCIREGEKISASGERVKANRDELYYLVGLSYLKEGDPQSAAGSFKRILNEIRNSKLKEEAQIGLGDSYFLQGNYVLAAFQYQQLADKNPKTKLKPALYYRLSQVGAKTANAEQEKEYTARLKKEFPLSPEARMDKGSFMPSAQAQTDNKPDIAAAQSALYVVQVGAFSRKDNARSLSNKLTSKGYTVFIAESLSGNKTVFKVRVGNFKSPQEARQAEKKLSKEGYPTKIIP